MIPVSEPLLGERELAYVTECMRTGWISSAGHFIEEFEQGWADYCGMRYGIALSNGTVALEVAAGCLDLQPGDEVIMPTFTIISCAMAVIYNGGVPVLVDADARTWCMDVNEVAAKITPRTRAIMPVHIYGHPVDMQPLWELARTHGLKIIEDAAEAHGAVYWPNQSPAAGSDNGGGSGQIHAGMPVGPCVSGAKSAGLRCGGLGDLSCFSFYANKIITTGEGGMVLTNDAAYAERARGLRNLCFRPERRFYHTELGHNYRLTNLQAAIGLAQLERVDELVARKRRLGQLYHALLCDVSGIGLPVEEAWATNVYWMYGLVLDDATGMDAVELARRLRNLGVETRPFFLGLHEQPVFQERGLFRGEHYPVAERIARQGLYLPSGLTLTESQVEQVCQAVRQALS